MTKLIKMLISACIILNSTGFCSDAAPEIKASLHTAAYFGKTEEIHRLIAAGTLVNEQDTDGKTPLHYAVENEHCDIVRILMARGANPNIKDLGGRTSFDYYNDGTGIVEIFEALNHTDRDVHVLDDHASRDGASSDDESDREI